MAHQRPHLDRAAGDVEVGVYDATGSRDGYTKHAAPHAQAPKFLRKWERYRPVWLVELVAEFTGVFLYCFCGVGATAAFTTSSAAKLAGFGGVLNIAVAYCLGIVFAVTIAGPVSGGHLSPAYTLCFALFKGFPARKVPQYILAQILGGYVAILCVYAQYKSSIDAVTAGITALAPSPAVASAEIFSPFGSAGILAIYPAPGQPLAQAFMNELLVSMMLSLVVFTVLDPTNAFVSFTSAAWLIGGAFLAMITAFSGATTVLNSARDLGGRLACMTIFGSAAFNSNKSYAAMAALTNILGTFFGALLQVFWLSDHRRPIINHNPGNAESHASKPSYSNENVSEVNGHVEEKAHIQPDVSHREYVR